MLMLGLYSGPPSSGGILLLDGAPFATDCTLTTNEHGFESLRAQLGVALTEAFRLYDAPGILYLGLFCYGQIVWEGRLEDPTLYAGDQGSGLDVQALGYWRALSDMPLSALYSTTDVSKWIATTVVMAAGYSDTGRYQTDTNNRLNIDLVKGNTYAANKPGGLAFSVPEGSSRDINGIQFALEINLPAAFTARVLSWTGDISGSLGSATVEASLAGTAALVTRAYHLLTTANPSLSFDINSAAGAAYAGETGASYARITHWRAVSISGDRVNTTLTANRAAGTNVTATVGSTAGMYVGMELVMNSGNNPSEIVTVLSIGSGTQFNATFVGNYVTTNTVQGFRVLANTIVDRIISEVATLNPAQLSLSTALLQSPGLDLTDEVYEDAAIGDVLTHLAALGDNQTPPRQWEVGVWEGQTLFFRPQNTANRAWYVDATDLSVVRTLEDLANSIYAVYKDVSGRALRAAATSDSASVARYGLTRRASISADTTSAVQAGVQQAAALADRKDPKPRATIQFDAVYDAAGARYPLWLVRSGDTMTIRNLPPNVSTSIDRIRTFRITHTSYDAFADTLDVEPEAAPRTLEVMLARRSEGIKS